MAHHPHQQPHVTRVFIACSPGYNNRRAIMQALASIFIDTIEEQREYYYFDCPAMMEIFDDGVFNRANFRRLATDGLSNAVEFTHIVTGGDEAFIAKLLSEIKSEGAEVLRLA